MIEQQKINAVIITNLKEYLGCEVIKANQINNAPVYPYVSFNIITPMSFNKGTFCETDKGLKFNSIKQIWSFTIHSNDDSEAFSLSLKAFNFFEILGIDVLNDNKIGVSNISNISNRDNLLSVEYEYKKGFDVTFSLSNVIENIENSSNEFIEKFNYRKD